MGGAIGVIVSMGKPSGPKYRYYMVFQDQALAADGAYPLDRFLEIARGL